MNSKKLFTIFLATTLFIILTCGTVFAATTVKSGTKRYIVKFKTSSINESQTLAKHSGKLKHQFKHINAVVADMTTQSLASLKKDSNVAYIEEDKVVKMSSTTYADWGISDINAEASFKSGLSGKGVKIGIIDSGVATHTDLTVAGGANVINGSNTTSYADDNGHGTVVTGIIAGKGLNGGVKGVAPDASIYAVKALDSTGSGYTSDIISGIDWAIENKMDIISMSLGSDESDVTLKNAVDTAYKAGILIVAAAGNDGKVKGTGTNVEYPANYDSVIAVGAVDSTNTRAYFSSTGNKVEVSAPGVNIMSTYLNGGYEEMSGTSMATPFVAGDLAILKQKYPQYTNIQLRQLLDTNVKDLGVVGRDSLYGYGLIQGISSTTSVITPVTVPVTVTTPITLPTLLPTLIPTPVASMASGSYNRGIMVQLYARYSEPLRAFYTLDGSTPTTKSTPYRGYIKINSTKTLKVIAVDSDGNISGVLSNNYNISKYVKRKI
ncbi:S8 family serine peptidase [Clostridium estertheticum]|uniref:S8 family serine peptidase n=1 Tax=Clostridium estertheticum TaxID=238834 RepID=UPI002714941F|nr:S8 family serine peptidase [Clostridium estertheticum]WLC76372.1 S8 family serine peptidase [Clostridium estertheticum]